MSELRDPEAEILSLKIEIADLQLRLWRHEQVLRELCRPHSNESLILAGDYDFRRDAE